MPKTEGPAASEEAGQGAVPFPLEFPALGAKQIPRPTLRDAKDKPEYAPRQLVEMLYPAWSVTDLKTDAAHAQRIRIHYGGVLAYNPALGWLYYNGRHWQRDDRTASGTASTIAPLSQVIREEAAQMRQLSVPLTKAGRSGDADAMLRAAALHLRFASRVETADFIKDALQLAAHAHTVEVEQFDQKPWVLGLHNGTWWKGTWGGHRADDFLLRVCPLPFRPDADRAEWEQVLARLTGGDADFERTLQDVVAYILSGASHSRLIPWLYGPRGTGKSTLQELLQTLLGEMSASIDPKYLQGDSQRERLGAAIWNKRLAICAEAGGAHLEAELLKTLSGGDSFPVRFLHREAFTAKPHHVLLMVANDPPKMNAYDEALRDRVLALPFNHPLGQNLQGQDEPLELTGGRRIEAIRSDPTSPLVLGFAAWALEGLERFYQTQEIYRARVVTEAIERFWRDTDPITPFWETVEEYELRAGMTKGELRGKYEAWCQAEGAKPVGRDKWKAACEARGLVERKSGSTRSWCLPLPEESEVAE